MKTYKTTSTVTVVLANGETVVHENAGRYPAGSKVDGVFSLQTGAGIRNYAAGEYKTITHTIECREVKKRPVYVVRYLSGLEFEYSDLFTAYNSVLPVSARGKLDSIRREEREELA